VIAAANATASSMLERVPGSCPRDNNSKDLIPERPDKPRMSRRFSAQDLQVTATSPPCAEHSHSAPDAQVTATAPPCEESPGCMASAAAQTPTLAKLRPRSAGGTRRHSLSASSGNLMHNTPQAARTFKRSESAADLPTLPRGRGLEAVRVRRQAF